MIHPYIFWEYLNRCFWSCEENRTSRLRMFHPLDISLDDLADDYTRLRLLNQAEREGARSVSLMRAGDQATSHMQGCYSLRVHVCFSANYGASPLDHILPDDMGQGVYEFGYVKLENLVAGTSFESHEAQGHIEEQLRNLTLR
jgi:hypothetical protein